MDKDKLWEEFCLSQNIDVNTPHECWAFCGGGPFADELGALVLEGKKFGTASIEEEYSIEGVDIPKVGDYSVLLDQYENAYAVIRNFDVKVEPFGRVSDYHGYSEGEGDRNLKSWRSIHEEYWKPDLEELNRESVNDFRVVCEKYCVEYVAQDQRLIPGADTDNLVDECFLIEPDIRYAEQIVAYREALIEKNDSLSGCLSLKRMPDPAEWVDYACEWGNPEREIPENGIRGTVLMCIRKRDDKLIGMIQVFTMPESNPRAYVGNVGYSVLPEERRKGYASWMLKKALDFLKFGYGLNEAYVSCVPDNEASRRTIIKNGGKYIETVDTPLEGEGMKLERYVISIK